MKKMLTVLVAFTVMLGCLYLYSSAYASSSEFISTDDWWEPMSSEVGVVPTVTIYEPGAIRVMITWEAPQLTFVRNARSTDNVEYYELQMNKIITFDITNNSFKSSNGGFSGDITVNASSLEKGQKRDNIEVTLTNASHVATLRPGESYKEYKLEYTNREKGQINEYEPENLLGANQNIEQIKSNMTAYVSFLITPIN